MALLLVFMFMGIIMIGREWVYLSLPIGLVIVLCIWTMGAMIYGDNHHGPITVWKYLFTGR